MWTLLREEGGLVRRRRDRSPGTRALQNTDCRRSGADVAGPGSRTAQREVLPAEDLRDRRVLEHGVDRVGDDLGDREHLELVDPALLGSGSVSVTIDPADRRRP